MVGIRPSTHFELPGAVCEEGDPLDLSWDLSECFRQIEVGLRAKEGIKAQRPLEIRNGLPRLSFHQHKHPKLF